MQEGEIIFNGASSIDDMNLKLEEYPVIPLLNRRTEDVHIDCRDGVLHYDLKSYDNRQVTFKFILNSNDYETDFANIDKWLSVIQDNRLFIDSTGLCFDVVRIIKGDTQKNFKTMGSIPVTFEFEPYKYDPNSITLNNVNNIYNPGDFDSLPIITLNGTGDISITINEEKFIVKDSKNKSIIDSKKLRCYSPSSNSDLKFQGDFPTLIPGDNIISSTATSFSITYRNRYR
ncbi:MAG: hypothetical protein SPJ62_00955 [Inconstantimicrobium porci]|uniref:hypothetical protein n=1 Tax=Inconstantimicrobium porci TaxID=2652291 RepID=UPI002A91A361|nr:hypothetical protein [Inconstantimicrobium porci]MDY5910587.1 hypothetical protein [Inconstantimicrobium porci]